MKIAICTLLLAAGWQLPAQELTARQLFYQKDDAAAKPSAKPDTAAPAPAPAPAKPAPKKVAKKSAPKPATAPPLAAPTDVMATPAEAAPAPASSVPLVRPAAYVQTESPLGLRYALVQVVNAAEREVSPQSTFHSGDMVRVKLEGNRNGYLYVIARGSSGNWKPLFPSPDINGGENRVAPHQRCTLPSSSQAFTFDEQPGEERIFLIYSAEPIRDIESMFPTLMQPAQADKPAGALPIITASAEPITDGFVAHMRQTYSRDLIVQTVTPSAPDEQAGDPMENAVYVVEKSGKPLVADIRLEHR
jgi:Domain of unknown function (DUF4384)